jgi:hypothetical protein
VDLSVKRFSTYPAKRQCGSVFEVLLVDTREKPSMIMILLHFLWVYNVSLVLFDRLRASSLRIQYETITFKIR